MLARRFFDLCMGVLLLALLKPTAAIAAWPTDPNVNLPVCTAVNDQLFPAIAPDGTGGAIIAWQDGRSGSEFHIYAQHVIAGGTIDAGWPIDGLELCTASGGQEYPVIVSDGAGGAIIAWQDSRQLAGYAIYAQHVLATGLLATDWPLDGRWIAAAAGDQLLPSIATDGAGGAMVAWSARSGGGEYDVYVQHVSAGGAVDAYWPPGGLGACTAPSEQTAVTVAGDTAGGAIINWRDYRAGSDVLYGQHVLGAGTIDPAWPTDGIALTKVPHLQRVSAFVPDGDGGTVSVLDDPDSTSDWIVYAQHELATGQPDARWPSGGRVVCSRGSAYAPSIVADGTGGTIAVWQDHRGSNWDVYAQGVMADGQLGGDDFPVPTSPSIVSAEVTEDGVRLVWSCPDRLNVRATVYRKAHDSGWLALATASVNSTGLLTYQDQSVLHGTRYGYRLGIFTNGIETVLGEVWLDVPAQYQLSLAAPSPNPSAGTLVVSFTLPTNAPATLDAFDISGRLRIAREVGSLGVGSHTLDLARDLRLPTGIILLRLTQNAQTATRKVTVVHR